MNIHLSDIVAPILDDLKQFQYEFELALKSEVRLVNTMVKYVIRNRGKNLRPILTILSARISGKPTLDSLRAAALVEILHIATLIHDDVVDESDLRRSWPSIRRVFNNKKAVLIGDFFLSKALSNMIGLRNFTALEALSKTAERLSGGEILQLEKSLLGGMTEEVYYRMVSDKTASLFGTACELGAITATKNETSWSQLRDYGENLGVAFQIKDDLFDLVGSTKAVGKPVVIDVKKNLRTLPLIYALKQLDKADQRHYLRLIKRQSRRGEIGKLKRLIADAGGVAYAEEKIEQFSQIAVDAIADFPDSEYKTSLINTVRFNQQRNR